VAARGSRAAWGSLIAGLASVAAVPLAIYLTRFSDSYELLHSAVAIPVAAGLGLVAVALARRARRRSALSLTGDERDGVATAGRVLGVLGLCLAAAGLVALAVYGLLEYAGTRE
jgi:hypothetical protein